MFERLRVTTLEIVLVVSMFAMLLMGCPRL